MKNTMKKILCAVLIAVMCITCLPVNFASATNTVEIPSDAVEFNGHYYKAYNISNGWTSAKTYCENLGGHLATITSQNEQNFIVANFLTGSPEKKCYFLGGYRNSSTAKEWFWVTGESFCYGNWAGGENTQTNEPNQVYTIIASGNSTWMTPYKWYSHMNYDSGTWTADWAGKFTGFICEWSPNEHTVSGKITGGSNTPKIAINGIWYEYDTTVPGLADAIDKFAINETITCKIRFGKIVACSKSKINSKATLSINTSDSTIEYDTITKKYSPDNISLTIDIANNIVSSSRGSVNTGYIAGYDITFDKIVIDIQDSDMLYFKDGWFGLGKTQNVEKIFDSPVTLKAGKTFYFNDDLTAFINDNYKWSETELKKDVKVYAYLYNKDKYICADELTVTFKNNEAQNTIKNNAEAEKQSQSAAAILDNTACIIQSDFLSEIFTKEQLKAIQSAIQCKIVLCALPESTYKKAGLEDKIIEKLMKKAGVSKDWLGTSYTADISLTVNVDTEKYGQLEIEFNIPTTYYSFGSDNPYGGTAFDFTYKIIGGKGKKNVPSDKLTGDILGLGTYANIKNFADSVQKVALSQLESAYNLGYGNDLNKVGDMLFGETITKILSKTKAKSYSHLTFTMMTFPAKQVKIHCPVDVYVYNPGNTLCASIENNEITMSCEDIAIEVVGDEKYLTIYDGDYSIEIIATAEDKMNISIEEFSYSDEKIRTASFDNIVLTPGDSFKTAIDTNYLDSEYIIAKNDEENISADADISFIHYVNGIEIIDKKATCTAEGEYHIECTECKKTVLTGSVPATGHSDNNCDGVCDLCSEDFTKNCTCMCHSNEFIRFIHKLLCFFYRIFGMNEYRVCSCGKTHW